MDCTQTVVDSDEEDDNPGDAVRPQVATLKAEGRNYPVFMGKNKIGRDPECCIAIQNMALSSQHAVIEGLECGIFLIYDLKSRNKTRLRKVILTPGTRYQLKNGDNIRFANVSCEFNVLEKPNLKSGTDTEDDDIPSTQVIDLEDDEEENIDMQFSKAKEAKASCEGKGSSSKRSGFQGKVPGDLRKAVFHQAEPFFKVPPSGNIKNLNDSFGYLNMSKDSSCNEDVDDDIFDLPTQSDVIETFSNQRNSISREDQDRKTLKQADISDLELNDPDCETSVSNIGNVILDSIPSEENSIEGESLEKEQNEKSSSIDELKDDEDIFCAATEDCSMNNLKESHTKGINLVANENETADEENQVSSATKSLTLKTNERNIIKPKVSSPVEDDETTDDEDIFAAATELFPMKTKEKNVRDSNKSHGLKDDELTDEEDVFSAATQGFKGFPLQPKEKDITSVAEDDITDEEDIFAAATESFPLKAEGKNIPESKTSSAIEDDEITDEEDIFAAATELFPLKAEGKNIPESKTSSAMEDDEITDEEDIFAAATESFPLKAEGKNVPESKTSSAIEDDEITDEEDIFAAATEQKNVDGGGFMKDSESASVQLSKGGNEDSEKILESERIPEESGMLSSTSQGGKEKNRNYESKENDNPDHKMDSDDEETDLEDDSFLSGVNEKRIKNPNAGKNESESGAPLGSGALGRIKKDGPIIDPDLCSDSESERDDQAQVKESDASYAIISDTDDEVEDKDCLNTSEGSGTGLANQDCKLKTNQSSNNAKEMQMKDVVNEALNVKPTESNSKPEFCYPNKAVPHVCEGTPIHTVNTMSCEGTLHNVESAVTDMTIDNTLPPSRIVLLEKGGKRIMDTHCKEIKDDKTVAIEALSSNPNYSEHGKTKNNEGGHVKVETLANPGALLNISIQNSESDDSKSFIMDTPMCSRNAKKVIKSFDIEDAPCGDEEDMSSFLTQAPPEFKTPTAAVRTVDNEDDVSEMATQPAPGMAGYQRHSKEHGEEEDEDMSSFLTQAPPEFKTPTAAMRKVDDEDDVSEMATQPAPGMAGYQRHSKEYGEEEDEDMSSFLTQAPPEFKTPTAAVRKVDDDDEDLSELATQPAPGMADYQKHSKEHGEEEDEDMSSFLTQAPPEFKTPTAAVRKVDDDDEDLSELATQPAPGMADYQKHSKEHGEEEDEDMSSFLTQAPPEFKTPTAAVRKVDDDDEDLSELATQPAPGMADYQKHSKEHGEEEDEDMSSFLTQAPPEFKTPTAAVRKVDDDDEDLSELATQPAPGMADYQKHSKEHGEEEDEDISSFLTQPPPDIKTSREAKNVITIGKKEDLTDLQRQSDLVLERNVTGEKAVTTQGKSDAYGSEDDLSLLDTQPAPTSGIIDDIKRKYDKHSAAEVMEHKRNETRGGLKANGKDEAQKDVLITGSELLLNRTPEARSSRVKVYLKKEKDPLNVDSPLRDGKGLISSSKTDTDDSDGSDSDFSFLLPNTPDIIRETSKEDVSNQQGSCRNLFLPEKLKTFSPVSKVKTSETILASMVNRVTRTSRNPSMKKKELMEQSSARASKAKRSDLKKGMVCETKHDLGGQIAVKEDFETIQPPSKSNMKNHSSKDKKSSTEVQKKNLLPPKCEITAFKTKMSLNLNDKLITSTPVASSSGLPEGSSESVKMSLNVGSYRRRNAESILGSTINSESICEIPEDTSPEMVNVRSGERYSKSKNPRKGNKYRKGEVLTDKEISAILSMEDSGKKSNPQPPAARVKESAPEAKSTQSAAEHGRKRNLFTPSVEAAPAGKVLAKIGKEERVSSDESAIARKRPKRHEIKTERPSVEKTSRNKGGRAVEVVDLVNEEGSHSTDISVDKLKNKLQGSVSESNKGVDSTYNASSKGKQGDSVEEVPCATRSISPLESTKESLDVVRRSERGRKPKRRFSVDSSPDKPQKTKDVCKTMEAVPSRMRRGRKPKKESGSRTNSSQESAFSSDSDVSNKRKSENSRNTSDPKRFKISAEESSSEKKSNDEESKDGRKRTGRRQCKGSTSTVDAVSEVELKAIETRLCGPSVKGMPQSVVASGSEAKPMAVNTVTLGRRRKGKVQCDASLATPEEKLKVGHDNAGGYEKQSTMLGVVSPSEVISKVDNVNGLGIKRRGLTKKEPVTHSKKTPESVDAKKKIEDPREPELDTDTPSSLVKSRRSMKDSPSESEVSVTRKGRARNNKGSTSKETTEGSHRTSRRMGKKESAEVVDSTENSSTLKRTSRKTGRKELTNTLDSMGNSSSKSTAMGGETPEKSKVDDEVKTGILENWRRISPAFKKSVENEEYNKTAHNPIMKVPPLRFSRIQESPFNKGPSGTAVVNSPLFNETTVTKSVGEEKSQRVRNQKRNSYNVLFTGLSDPKLVQIVKNLGGSVVDTIQNFSVLVTDRLRRTYKLLCAIARGIPVVTVDWLMQSSSNGRFLEPYDFLVCDKVTEKRFDFTLKTSLEKAKAKPLFSGFTFIATPAVLPPPGEVQGIVTCAGGEYVTTTEAFVCKNSQLSYVVSCLDDAPIWDQYRGSGPKKAPRGRPSKKKANMSKEPIQTKLVGVEALLVSVLRQKIDLENKEFQLV